MKRKLNALEAYIMENKENHYRFAYSYVKDPNDALDVVQESILKAMEKVHQLRDEKAIKSWFYQIIARTALDFIKKEQRCTASELSVIEYRLPSYEDRYEDLDLKKALAFLPYEYRVIVHLRFFEAFKIDEIAGILNLNINTVKTRLYSALKKLRIELEEGCYYE